MTRGAYLILLIAKTQFAAPVPDLILEQLKPHDWSEALLEIGIQQICILPEQIDQVSLTRQNVLGAAGIKNKLLAFQKAIFPSETMMALRYGIEPKSKTRLMLLLFRWRSLAKQAFVGTRKKRGGETAVSIILKRKRNFLHGCI